MKYVEIDMGSTASKVMIKGDVDTHFILPTGWSSKETINAIKERLKPVNVDVFEDDTKVVATGYGRIAVDFADRTITEITCHARGDGEIAGTVLPISSLCTVFAESEVINYIGEGRKREDIAAGVVDSVVAKVAQLSQHKLLPEWVIFTGGLSHSVYFTDSLSEKNWKKGGTNRFWPLCRSSRSSAVGEGKSVKSS